MFHRKKKRGKSTEIVREEEKRKARIGLEPMNNGFANRPLNHLGIAPYTTVLAYHKPPSLARGQSDCSVKPCLFQKDKRI
jgi:hypothetical protein